ncbi:MAG: DUF1684 domain-containing protein [Anaerolineae bacterium]|nr:DUF1684 domain-containing protein [Anaerolineae bacterium]
MTPMIHPQTLEHLSPFEALADYRRAVANIYAEVRRPDLAPDEKFNRFRRARDVLFGEHPQSPLSPEQKATFTGLNYYPYNPAWRFVVPVDPNVTPDVIEIELEHDGKTRLQRFGKVYFEVSGLTVSLSLFWILGYGGGIFLPFRDLTNGHGSYGGGRYLLDTIKHADLGHEGDRLVLDFNYAYNPSCAYNPQWFCPLAPAENRLPVAIEVGEKDY